ncbi:MAG: acyltransferase [Candidatus Krumholzibacteriota bacterium]
MKEIRPLTSLRAIAAFLVFMFHYADAYSPANRGIEFAGEWIPFMFLWRQGDVGVSVFFVLSGFLITRIYYDTLGTGRVPMRRYFVKRVARIWPLFLVFALIQHTTLLAQGAAWSRDFLVTMTMTQSFFSGLVYEGLPVAWSLTVEECFYLLAPLSFAVLARFLGDAGAPSQPLRLLRFLKIGMILLALSAAVMAAGLLIVKIVQTQGWGWRGFMDSNFHMNHSTIFGRFLEFALGMAAAFVHRGLDLERILREWRGTAAALGAGAGIVLCMLGKDLLDGQTGTLVQAGTYVCSYGLAFFSGLLILALSVTGGWLHRLLGHGLPVYLGKVSYGFYLIQLTVMMDPLMRFTDRLGQARLPVLVVLTTLVCVFFYRVVEVPARRYIVTRWAG